MRPVLLEMTGFASFRDATALDFTDADYFTLVGPTGSGKSTVLDAMSFALYGSVHRWDNPHLVKYALAPTANRATVRLFFDIGPNRYVVAREVRRSGAGITGNYQLERLTDPAGLGAADDVTEVLAADKAVTPAVENLLGLTFDQFCTCVVLPQGDFAEFLHAKPGDRQKILLKLLGADRYDAIARAANSVAADARTRVIQLTGQVAEYADATEEAEQAAAQREHRLRELERRVGSVSLPELVTANDDVRRAREAAQRLESERERLADVTIPVQAAQLDSELATASAAVERALRAERQSDAADTAARERVAAAPPRAPLEQARRDHAEHARITTALPIAGQAATDAQTALQAAAQAVRAAAAAAEQGRSVKEEKEKMALAAEAIVAGLTAERDLLGAIAIPADLTALHSRATRTRDHLLELTKAEIQEAEVEASLRERLLSAPKRSPLELALQRLTELASTEQRLPALAASADQSDAAHRLASESVTAAEQHLTDARGTRESAAQLHQAAALRAHLIEGQSCPVCEQPVQVLPPPVHAPELAAADEVLAMADRAVRDARGDEVQAATRAGTALAALAGATDRAASLRESLAGQPADPDAVRAGLAELDRLEADAQAAARRLRDARNLRTMAREVLDEVEQQESRAWAHLRAARDPVVPLGAPPERADLLATWTALAQWAGDALADRTARLALARADAGRLATELADARRQFDAAERAAEERRTDEQRAMAAAERTRTDVDGLRDSLATVTEALRGAPSDDEARAGLAERDRLETAAGDCDRALRLTRAEREKAERAKQDLQAVVVSAWQQLRSVRDRLVELGAPDLPEGQLLAAWTSLTDWAVGRLEAAADDLAEASGQVTAATERADRLRAQLASALAEHEVTVPDGDLATTAGPAVAVAAAEAAKDSKQLARRRETANRLRGERAAAETEAAVAKTLGDLLSASNFQRWLAASALDTLLVDASANLMALSKDQFELTHADGDLVVVDHADADSLRPVRTLSGGETFQASLALALALSAQLSTLAADGVAGRLDSIFLDEGFGTLDETALEIVASTLDNLGRGDRMVGVVTHVRSLAEQVPVRFEVSRDERTSTLVRQAL